MPVIEKTKVKIQYMECIFGDQLNTCRCESSTIYFCIKMYKQLIKFSCIYQAFIISDFEIF